MASLGDCSSTFEKERRQDNNSDNNNNATKSSRNKTEASCDDSAHTPVAAFHYSWDQSHPCSRLDANELAKELVHYSKILCRTQLKPEERNQQPSERCVTGVYDIVTSASRESMTDEKEARVAQERIANLLNELETMALRRPSRVSINAAHSTLVSLSYLVPLRGERSVRNIDKLEPMIQGLWIELGDQQAERYLCPRRWLECLQVATVLRLQQVSTLHVRICERLTKGDAIARLQPYQLVQALAWAATRQAPYARPSGTSRRRRRPEDNDWDKEDLVDWYEVQFLRAVAKRLRKQGIRMMSSNRVLTSALCATAALIQQAQYKQQGPAADDLDNSGCWESDLKKLAYTLLNEKLQRLDTERNRSLMMIPTVITSKEMAAMFGCVRFVVDNGSDVMVHQLCKALELNTTLEHLTFSECAGIFDALTQWHYPLPSTTVRNIGEALAIRTELWQGRRPLARDVNSVFRGASLLCQPCGEASPFRLLAESLFLDKQFLQSCGLSVLSNFAWFASMAGLSENVANTLGNQILQTLDMKVEIVSPKIACRILSSLTTLVVDRVQYNRTTGILVSVRLRDLLFQLFDALGDSLFSKRLDTHDISSALVAYAKAGYTLDLNVIDHLTATLVIRLESIDCSVRQVAQSLWALAKISEWDLAGDRISPRQGSLTRPTFPSQVQALASHLSGRASQLSTKDTTQTIWALARLELFDEASIALWESLLARVDDLLGHMTAQEIANCFWTLSKIPIPAFKTLFELTQQLRRPSIMNALKPQEATAILYALGRLDIRDERLFGQLSQLILSKVECTSSPAIAHVLWAHKRVHLTPPQQILDAWTSKKLGIMPISSMKNDGQDMSPFG